MTQIVFVEIYVQYTQYNYLKNFENMVTKHCTLHVNASTVNWKIRIKISIYREELVILVQAKGLILKSYCIFLFHNLFIYCLGFCLYLWSFYFQSLCPHPCIHLFLPPVIATPLITWSSPPVLLAPPTSQYKYLSTRSLLFASLLSACVVFRASCFCCCFLSMSCFCFIQTTFLACWLCAAALAL